MGGSVWALSEDTGRRRLDLTLRQGSDGVFDSILLHS